MEMMVYKVMANGIFAYVCKTEKEALAWIKTGSKALWGDAEYTIISQVMELPETTGKLFVDEDTVHVEWRCPYCGDFHFTDLDTDEESPAFWLCETGTEECLCLVHFLRK
jgi:hypothetical protein